MQVLLDTVIGAATLAGVFGAGYFAAAFADWYVRLTTKDN